MTPNPFHPYDLRLLAGIWRGGGSGEFPTIDSFTYKEELEVTVDPDRGYLHYVQNTLLLKPDGSILRPTHWETGLIRPREDNRITLTALHINSRFEVLAGTILAVEPGVLEIDFVSETIGNDERMVSSSRSWTVKKNTLTYDMYMATSKVPSGALHLKGKLDRMR